MKNKLLYACIFLLFCFASSAQQTIQYSFKHFSISNGLASNGVSAIVQDKDGFMWFATINGLQRYDGHSFVTVKHDAAKKNSIPADHILSLFVDRNKNLWMIGDHRVGIFDTRTFSFREVAIVGQDTSRPQGGKYLFENDKELLLHDLSRGPSRYDLNKQQFVPFKELDVIPNGWSRRFINWDAHGKKYWIGADSGALMYNPVTKNLNYRGHNSDNDPAIKAFSKDINLYGCYVDKEGNFSYTQWAPGEGAPTLLHYNKKTQRREVYHLSRELGLGYHEIGGFLQQRNGRTWVFGSPFFAEWTKGAKSFVPIPNEYRSEQSIKFDYVYNVFEDAESNVWIGTDNGVFMFNPDKQIFKTYALLRPGNAKPKDAPVQAVVECEGKIFVGCWGAGLFVYDQQFKPVALPSSLAVAGNNMSVWDMTIHEPTGTLWIVQQGGDITIYDPKRNRIQKFLHPIFNNKTIRQVVGDEKGNLWFGTHSGKVIKWDYAAAKGNPQKGYSMVLETGMVSKMHIDAHNYLWVAALGHGLYKIDIATGQVAKKFDDKGAEGDRLFNIYPSDMSQYDDTTLIVTAGCINVLNTRTNKINFIGTKDGLPSNTAVSVQCDKRNTVWVGMDNGLCRVNLQKRIVTHYNRKDGIVLDKFSSSGVEELEDGRVIFFTDHNFMAFNPDDFVNADVPPPSLITGFKLAGKSLSLDSLQKTGRIVLRYNSTSIGIDFSALSYIQQRKLHYYYMLEGLDEDWTHSDQPIQAIYNYLPPGDYIFKVKTENADGDTNPHVATIPILVRAPVWRTWWFYGLIALLVILILFLLDRERMQRLRSMQQMRAQIANNLHREINTTLSNINVLSEIAKIKADKNIAQSKDFIDQISDKSRQMIEAMDDMLWSISPENDTMSRTIMRMKEMTEALQNTHGISIDLIVDRKIQQFKPDMRVRHEVYFFYKEVIGFMAEQLHCTQIFVYLKRTKSSLLLELISEGKEEITTSAEVIKNKIGSRIKSLGAQLDVVTDKKTVSVVMRLGL